MEVRHPGRSGTLVQVIDVLRQHLDLEIPLQSRDGFMPGIGPCGEHLAAAHVVKFDDRGTVMRQCLGGADILDPVGSPQPVGIAEGRQTAVGAYPRTRKNDDFFHKL